VVAVVVDTVVVMIREVVVAVEVNVVVRIVVTVVVTKTTTASLRLVGPLPEWDVSPAYVALMITLP
jgi:hypothetical protein